MRIFLTGISGLLGLNAALILREGYEVHGCFRRLAVVADGVRAVQVDLLDVEAARRAIERGQPDVIVHSAALTDVDRCQESPETALALNVSLSGHVASLAVESGARLIHVSTDQVFNGEEPWRAETDPPAPINEYGRTKLRAEEVVAKMCPGALIVRTSFFGWGHPGRRSLSDWVLDGLGAGRALTGFADVYFTPILVNDLVPLLLGLLVARAEGIYHVGGRDRLSKYDFALAVADAFSLSRAAIRSGQLQDVALTAPRPRDLSLTSEKAAQLLGQPMPRLGEGLGRLRHLQLEGWPQRLASAVRG